MSDLTSALPLTCHLVTADAVEVDIPPTHYARSDDVHIAYQVFGSGALDVVVVPGFVSHLEHLWQDPVTARLRSRLASFARVVVFDKRGTGMSDRVSGPDQPLERRMDDVRAVMDAAGVERAALWGISEGGPMAVLFAATYPDRCQALVLYGSWVRRVSSADWPWAPSPEEHEELTRQFEDHWGEPVGAEVMAPSLAEHAVFRERWAAYPRASASPGAVAALFRMNRMIDVGGVLPAVRVPVLVIHRANDRLVPVENGRYLAERLPDARYVELEGDDHVLTMRDVDPVIDDIQEFLTGAPPTPEAERVLVTVMFTDLVASTARNAELGDRGWRATLDQHDDIARHEVERHRGVMIKCTGDGLLATFDGPARAIRCAQAMQERVRGLGLRMRAGLHTGEIELRGQDLHGLAVVIGQRVSALAGPDEVLVSSTVRDLVAGSGIEFDDRGRHRLKGVPEDWRIFAAVG
jgi:class 3 adenylate cyclase